jgi:hypothetical protein
MSVFCTRRAVALFTRLGFTKRRRVYTDRAGMRKGGPQFVSVCDSPWFNCFAFDALKSLCYARSSLPEST